jgi:hypothetical protein
MMKKDEQKDAAAADNADDAIAHDSVSGALGEMLGHRLGEVFQRKAQSSTTSGAGSRGARDSGLSITNGAARFPAMPLTASRDVPANHRKVERKQY